MKTTEAQNETKMKTTDTTAAATSYGEILATLTPLEVAALRSAYSSSAGNGHDFGYTEDIYIVGLDKKAVGGLITSLLKKGVMIRDREFGQFAFLSFGESEQKSEALKQIENL